MEYIKSTKNTVTPPLAHEISLTTRTTSSSTIPFIPVSVSVTSLNMSIIDYTGPIISTSTSPPPSQSSTSGENAETVVGASIAGVVVFIYVVFLLIFLLKRRMWQCVQSKQHKAKSVIVFENTTYDDLVETNQKENVCYANTTAENDKPGSSCQMNDIYVGK